MTFLANIFGWILRICYDLFHSYGIAIILFAVFAKLITLPFQMKSKKSMMDMQRIQPKLRELEKKYKNHKDPEMQKRYSLEVQKLYKEENVSLFGGCVPMLIMFPIMIILYQVVREPLTYIFGVSWDQIYSIAANCGINITNPNYMIQTELTNAISSGHAALVGTIFEGFNFKFLGIDLAAVPNFNASVAELQAGAWVGFIVPILSGITSWFSSWIMRKTQGNVSEQAAQTNGMMSVMMPLISVWIAFMVPAGLGLYWIMSNVLSAIQEPLLSIYYKKKAEKNV